MTSETWICERTHSLCLSPDVSINRSQRPEARQLVAVECGCVPEIEQHFFDNVLAN